MNEVALKVFLKENQENEVIEFKTGKDGFDFDSLGKYFSALSNEANLKSKEVAWLILGVNDKREIVGTRYLPNLKTINETKLKILTLTNNGYSFSEIYPIDCSEGRVLIFRILPALPGIPVSFKGHYYAREGESLVALSLQKIEKIRGQAVSCDWSVEIVENASIDDLNPLAITKARAEYKQKHPKQSAEIDQWSDQVFLNKAKLTIQNKITKTVLLLLGKEESAHLLNPAAVKVSWILKNATNRELDYEHFSIPFILNSEKILAKIRNLTYRYMPDNTLFPTEIAQYDSYVIREALHNCIAHQDYNIQSKIVLVEFPEHLVFENAGKFLPETVENVIQYDAPQKFYRNKFLCEAMVNLNMIDTIGSGIKKMFSVQRKRFFPLPEYDLTKPYTVKVTVFGKVLDKNYTQLLMNKTDLDLTTVVLLDKLQKKANLGDDQIKMLKSKNLIEGRKPNFYIAAPLANLAGQKAQYIKNRGFKDEYYKKRIVEYIHKFGSANRQDIEELLLNELPQVLSLEQKRKKITNLLNALSKKEEMIKNVGKSRKHSLWVLKAEVLAEELV